MRIVMMGDYPRDPEHIGGGVESITLYLLKGLRQFSDLELHMITVRSDVTEKVALHGGVTVHYIMPSYRLNAFTFGLYHQHLLRQKITALQPDLIHAHIAGAYPLAAAGTGIPFVLSLHGIRRNEMTFWRGWRNQLYRRWLVTFQEWASIRLTKHIIATSPPYIRKEFGHIIRGTIYDIENPVKDHFFEIERCEQPNRVFYAGHLSVRKGIYELLQSMNLARQHVPDLQLRLAGRMDVDPAYVEQLHAYVHAHKLGDCVHFLGPLDEASLLEEYARCALLVLSSRQETAPMVIEQAMAARVPVVATRVGGVDYLVDHGRTGFVVEFADTKGMSEAIVRLLSDANLRVRMGIAGRFEAEKRFRASEVARQTRQVYDQILGRSLPRMQV
jgi:glycosyltransferase involved in cell wall biosynthesis